MLWAVIPLVWWRLLIVLCYQSRMNVRPDARIINVIRVLVYGKVTTKYPEISIL